MSAILAVLPLSLAVLFAGTGPTGTRFPLVVGGAEPGFVDGDAETARFDKPIRLAPFGDDAVLVADISNDALRVVRLDGAVSTLASSGEVTATCTVDAPPLAGPHGVSIGRDGRIAIAEASGHTVRLLELTVCDRVNDWQPAILAGAHGESGLVDGAAAEARFASPHAVAWAADGALWIADIGNRRLRLLHDGEVTTVAGGDDGPFVYPMDLALHPEGGVVAIDAATGKLYRVKRDGEVAEIPLERPLETPHGVAVTETGIMVIAEMDGHRVVGVGRRGGAVRTVHGTGRAGSGENELSRPAAVLIHRGRLFVADLDNHRIVVLPSPDPVEP